MFRYTVNWGKSFQLHTIWPWYKNHIKFHFKLYPIFVPQQKQIAYNWQSLTPANSVSYYGHGRISLYPTRCLIGTNHDHWWRLWQIVEISPSLFISGFDSRLLKGLSHQIFKSFLSFTILNQYFLYVRWWFKIFFIKGFILKIKNEVLMYITQNAS